MDAESVIFWTLILACLASLAMIAPRARSAGPGWVMVYAAVLLVALLAPFSKQPVFTYVAAGMWLILILLPALVGRLYQRRFLQHDYSGASRLARVISWLHPLDGWREQPRIVGALALAQQGDLAAAVEVLDHYRHVRSLAGMTARIQFYRLTGSWEEFLKWNDEYPGFFDQQPQLLAFLLRAKGETGDVRGMVELYERRKEAVRKLIPVQTRDMARLPLFAFCGRRNEVGRLFAGSLAATPGPVRDFWLATADQAAGLTESARQQFTQLLPTADASLRLAVQRRLAQLSSAPAAPLDPAAGSILDEASREQGHDERFAPQRTLFSRHARATQILILLNLAMFAAELVFGGSNNLDALYQLGAFFPPAVRAGEWWRFVAALFLHAGPLHLAANMLALWLLGPFVEFALGFWRYLLVYLGAGVGSMAVVMVLGSGPSPGSADDQLTLGASGCIMGLVGATGTIMLRAWRREKAFTAKKRLTAMILVIVMQTLFDSMVPHVSMTAHLSGAMIGFAVTLWLRDRLAQASQRNP